jgi:polyphosphate glucokinase
MKAKQDVILGIDFGGSGIKGGLVDMGTGQMITERHRIPTPQPAMPKPVTGVIAQIVQHFGYTGPVGIGFPAAIINGTVMTASNIHETWIGTEGAKMITEATNCPTYLINDADAAGMAEMRFGAGKGFKGSAIMITVGTGLGVSLFFNGQIMPNCELGHLELNGQNSEKYASDATRKKEDLSWKKWAKRFNEYLEYLDFLFWPELFIIGGGASKKFGKFEEHLKIGKKTKIVPAELENHAGIIGAAVAAKQNLP